MFFKTCNIVVFSIFVLAAAILLNSNGRQHMASLLQFGKSLFSARQTNINDPTNRPSFYDRQFTDIQGQPVDMNQLRGKVALLVNTASECGYTPQLYTLQELHDKYKDKGFTVLGVPCNNFGKQEPGDEPQVCSLYASKFKTTFPLTTKQDKDKPSEVFQWIIDAGGKDVLPQWNFHKYLIDRQGHLVAAWNSRVKPLDEEITKAIESIL
ncbi:unnamed protein product [Rotaria magnacalcarata]|uniref:Glutathione peroxidase n=1 Tax=Rotaria magnacalcarata TaxID=392030 RepID=A0A815KZS2_9BILA|nr:unnamed protein product [Rotaria magnacalcarata]CAF1399582.1 unnamed protein product [Rotaria magnacalcarata]CAF1948136.1 unnamed protein product [Rotaria magnacalcarata]CAF3796843.1 unnamed protein product [Rotaria magnacalcarata]CAF3895405.1 unnamed protein product [Rotaria magnacalcarata]